MPIEITMPRLSDTMEEGTLIKWRVSVGDAVSAGDHLADVETDKATMELQAFDDGTIAKLAIDEGATVPVGELIVVLAEDGESVDDAAATAGSNGQAGSEGASKADDTGSDDASNESKKSDGTPDSQSTSKSSDSSSSGKSSTGTGSATTIRVSPLARKLAEEHGIDLATIAGSGPQGRIIKRDILKAADGGSAQSDSSAKPTTQSPKAGSESSQDTTTGTAPAPVASASLESKTITLSGMRKTIAKRLVESKTTVPHFTVTTAVDVDPLLELRSTLNSQLEAQGVKLSVNDFLVRASALACVQHPIVNSSWADDAIQLHGTVNVGIAVALPEEKGGGLVVPVLRDVQNMGLRAISQQTKTLATKARGAGLTTDEMAGGTFTISNLGMFDVEHFEAIINPPQAAILAVGSAVAQPVVRDGEIVPGHVMRATLSADHRVIDGALAAQYLQTLKELLENPAGLLV